MNTSFAQQIIAAYPLNSPENDLANLGPVNFTPPAHPYGLQYRRTTTYYTDSTFVANRRLTCQTWAQNSLPAYCYNFNAIPSWAGPFDGATHFVEVAFAMKNLGGVGYAPVRTPPFQGLGEGYRELATLMSGDWVAFINKGNPNEWEGRGDMSKDSAKVPNWDEYSEGAKVFEFEGNRSCVMVSDDWRKEGMDLINSVNKEVYDK
jgi:acetylcholinesterase